VAHIWDFHLSRYKSLLEKSPQMHTLRALALRGIAFHHSGLLPFLKEILEILFSKGYVKLLFATETFAVGINMPTKTVIFTSLQKFTDAAFRPLLSSEYIQMAGRGEGVARMTRDWCYTFLTRIPSMSFRYSQC
jgi:superfamily II RNA helicase